MTWRNIKHKCGTHVLEDMHGQKEINEVGTLNRGGNSPWLVWQKSGVKMFFIRYKIDDPSGRSSNLAKDISNYLTWML